VTPLHTAPTRTARRRRAAGSGVETGEELGEHAGVESCGEVTVDVVSEVEGGTEEPVGADEEVR
jgi:hypothetical protein